MRYINREFGFLGRPPYFNDFYEEHSKGELITKECYLTKPIVGVGLDEKAPNGVLLCGKLGTLWGVKFSYYRAGKLVEPKQFFENKIYTANSRDNNFRYFACEKLMVATVKYSKNAYVLSFSAFSKVTVRVTFYNLRSEESIFKASETKLQAKATERAMFVGNIDYSENITKYKNRIEVLLDRDISKWEHFAASLFGTGAKIIEGNQTSVTYEITLDTTSSRAIIYCAVGDENIYKDEVTMQELIGGINNEEILYTKEAVQGFGNLTEHIGRCYSSIYNHKIYNPLNLSVNYVEKRRTKGFYAFDCLEMSTANLVSAIIGNISDKQMNDYVNEPMFGSLSCWVAYCRTKDEKILTNNYKKIQNTFRINGDLETTNMLNNREISYKMFNSPLKNTRKEVIYTVEFSCFKLMTLEILEKIAVILNDKRYKEFSEARKELKSNINLHLYNPNTGYYMDKYVRGDFLANYSPSNFFPLVAGVVEDTEVLNGIIINLANRKSFYDNNMISSIYKKHPYYKKSLKLDNGEYREDYEDYTGSIIPRLNFMVYLGLVRCGVNVLSTDLATSSTNLYSQYVNKHNYVPNILYPNGKMPSKCIKDSLSGNLLGLIGMMELIDVEYFRNDSKTAIKFGSMVAKEQKITNIKLFRKNYSVIKNDNSLELIVDNEIVFNAKGGIVEVRHYFETEDEINFLICTNNDINIEMKGFMNCKNRDTVHFNLKEGRYNVMIRDNKVNFYRTV